MGLRKALVRILGDLREILDTDILYAPKLSVGTTESKAKVHIAAGTVDEPPMIIEPGPLSAVLINGAIEMTPDGKFYFTINDEDDPTKDYLTDWDGTRLQDFDGTDLYINLI